MGRPWLYGVGAAGEEGVTRCLVCPYRMLLPSSCGPCYAMSSTGLAATELAHADFCTWLAYGYGATRCAVLRQRMVLPGDRAQGARPDPRSALRYLPTRALCGGRLCDARYCPKTYGATRPRDAPTRGTDPKRTAVPGLCGHVDINHVDTSLLKAGTYPVPPSP
eukprot:3314798-Rhodomonas_salina.1